MRFVCTIVAAFLPCILLLPAVAQDAAFERFTDHGIAVPVAQMRGLWATQNAHGNNLVIARSTSNVATETGRSPRGWMLVTDIDSGVTEQVLAPEDVPAGATYQSFGVHSSNHKLYTSENNVFLEYDLNTRQWTFQGRVNATILNMAEGPDGTIWIGGVYRPGLFSYNPETQELVDHGRMDDQERYLSNIAFDDQGWVYCGMGTARANIVAFNPATGDRHQLVPEERRTTGTGQVWIRADGNLYGRVPLAGGHETYRLSGGEATLISAEDLPPAMPVVAGGKPVLPDGRVVFEVSLAGRYMDILNPETEQTSRIEFDYETEGASLRPQAITAGADGRVYVNSGHPPYFAYYDPAIDTLTHFPSPIGQQCLTTVGKYIIGGRYTGGKLKVFDTTQPFDATSPMPERNPFRAVPSSRPDINRPIVAFGHPDGEHVMIAGMPGYGRAGGGLSIYNLETEEITKLTHEQLIEHHSITAIEALPNGNLVCSTTVSGTHGGHAVATEAVIFELDWATKLVLWQTAPLPEAGSVRLLRLVDDDRLCASGPDGVFFVFDLNSRQVIHQQSLADYGGVGSIVDLPDGRVYMTTNEAILQVDLDGYQFEKVTDTPVPMGRGVVLGDRIYFAHGPRLWSYQY
jgi:hypothetical protein